MAVESHDVGSTQQYTSRNSSGQEHQDSVAEHSSLKDEKCSSHGSNGVHTPEQQAEDKDAEKAAEPSDLVAKEDFSVFTVPQKRAIVLAGSFISWFSPMTGSIYYPALNQIARDLKVSDAKINITVTTYLILQGLAPMMIAGFSDKAGRRPAYFICFSTYVVANLALALQDNYIALLILRMVQSAGSSGTVALAQGLVGDCIVSSERGKYVAYASIGSLLGPTISPLFGGLLSQYLGWHSIFWFLLIFSGVTLVPLVLFLPETCRNLVGDGSYPPPRVSANITDHIRQKNRKRKGLLVDQTKLAELRQNYRISFPNPIGTLRVLADFESALLLIPAGLIFSCFYAISTGASKAFHSLYGFDELLVSLMFLPLGAGSIISAFTTGMLIDWNYRRHAKMLNFPTQKNRETDLSDFPIEKARLQITLPLMFGAAVATIGYGWLINQKVSLAGPIVMLFILGYTFIAASQCLTTLLIDIYPGKPATATAANNVCRCCLGAAATAAIGPMSDALGNGWAYTILALLFVVSSIGTLFVMKHGIKWRKAKKAREDKKQLAKSQKARDPP